MELTARQRAVLEFVKRSMLERQRPPTVHEIAEHMGYRSDNAAYQHLKALERKGVLVLSGRSRGIELKVPLGLPVVGRVAAGAPILAEENIEDHWPVDGAAFRPRADFLLRVRGMSMKNAGIHDGDLLAVHRSPVAEQNQIVVARVEDEVTVKRYRRRGDTVQLLPENEHYSVIRVDLRRQRFAIEGIMCGLVRPRGGP
ncbi:MAG: LexA repressor [Gammaproteobacteria bacterium]|nr:MAG: LexA repressor [Gammaproteobacteria bacterium]